MYRPEGWQVHLPGSVRVCDGKHATASGCTPIAEAEIIGIGRNVAVQHAVLIAAAPRLRDTLEQCARALRSAAGDHERMNALRDGWALLKELGVSDA